VTLRGEPVDLRGDRTVYWPRERALVVADVHVGRTESLRGDGVSLPDGAMFDDVVRLSAAIEDSGAERLIVIGDFIHDAQGLTPVVREFVAKWRRTVPCTFDLVIGNHDRRVNELPAEWHVTRHDPFLGIPPLAFSHDDRIVAHHTLVGHVHPAVRLSGKGDGVKVPCFVLAADAVVLPAFSSLAGGAVVSVAPGDRVVAVVDGYVVEVPQALTDF
jgi:DNA ligase-associated metallophosphoesterase